MSAPAIIGRDAKNCHDLRPARSSRSGLPEKILSSQARAVFSGQNLALYRRYMA